MYHFSLSLSFSLSLYETHSQIQQREAACPYIFRRVLIVATKSLTTVCFEITHVLHIPARRYSASVIGDGGEEEEEEEGVERKREGVEADRSKFDHPIVRRKMDIIEAEQRDTFTRFVMWLQGNGAKFPDLYFKCYSKDVRGVHTRRSVPPYQQIMSIPLKCIITDETGRQTPMGQRLRSVSHQLTVPNHCQVIVYMMTTMKQGGSFFEPYYATIPTSFENFPIFWSKKELAYLDGSDLVHQIEDRKRNIRSDYDTICRVLPEFRVFSFEKFLWCRTAVGSRNFSIVVNGEKRTAMVPMADMLNHYRPRETSWTYDNSQESFTMTSLKTLYRSAQVMDSYGKKCNSKFLLHYGFTIECNREADGKCQNEIEITLSLRNTKSSNYEKKCQFVSKKRKFRITMNHEDRGTAEALAFLRVAVATEGELRCLSPGPQRNSIGPENELAALSMLGEFAKRKLNRYPTTMAEDTRKLNEPDLDPFGNLKHALIVLRGEKEILHFYANLVGEIAPLLVLPKHARSHRIREMRGGRSDLERFITAVGSSLSRQGK